MAVLPKQNVVVTFGGLDQKNPNTVGVPGELRTAQNLQIQRAEPGSPTAFEFTRRNGTTAIAQATAGAARLLSYRDTILMWNEGVLWGYSPNNTTPISWASKTGQPTLPVQVGREDVRLPSEANVTGIAHVSYDTAAIGNLVCYVSINNSSLQFGVRDAASGMFIAGNFLSFSSPTNAKVVALGNAFYVFWKQANAILGAIIGLTGSGYTLTSPVTVIAAGSCLAGTDFDVQAGFDATHIALMYRSDSTHHVRCLLSTALAVGTSVSDSNAPDQPDVAMAWFPQDTYGSVLYYATVNSASGMRVYTANSTTLAITVGPTNYPSVTSVVNLTGCVANGVPTAIYEVVGGSGHAYDRTTYVTGGRTYQFLGLASRAFYLGGVPSFVALYNSDSSAISPQNTYYAVGIDSSGFYAYAYAVFLPRQAGVLQAHSLSSTFRDSSGGVHFLGTRVTRTDSQLSGVTLTYGLTDLSVTMAPATLGTAIEFAGVTLMPGGQVQEVTFDGNRGINEIGTAVYPEPPTLTEGLAGSGAMQPGTRSYVARFMWTDPGGQIYRSAPSAPVSITTVNANSSVSVNVGNYSFFPSFVNRTTFVEIYCTPTGGTGDEYFSVFAGFLNVLPYVDVHSETLLAAGLPFNPSGELDNIPPPALHVLCAHKQRVFGICSEQPWRVYFSKEYEFGTALGWSDAFVLSVPDSTPLYALASMDGRLIGIARDRIYVWDGDYPDATGGGAPIPLPTLLPAQVGCDQPRSLVMTELGLAFYSSQKGFNLLDRSLQPTYIGAAVETEATGQVISGAAVHPSQNQIRFTSEGGTTFILDTHWTKTTGKPVWMTFTGQPCVGSMSFGGDWYLLTSDGLLRKEDLARWQDGSAIAGAAFTAGAAYLAKLVISDINFAGVGGLARIWRGQLLGEWYDSHKVTLALGNDHRSVAGQSFDFDATNDPDPYLLQFRVRDQKATSMNVTITDTADYQTQGFAWTALVFLVGVKPGLVRTPMGRNMTGGA